MKKKIDYSQLAMWVALGPGMGLPVGVAIDNIPIGLAIGMCMGLAIGVVAGQSPEARLSDTHRKLLWLVVFSVALLVLLTILLVFSTSNLI